MGERTRRSVLGAVAAVALLHGALLAVNLHKNQWDFSALVKAGRAWAAPEFRAAPACSRPGTTASSITR